jgi:hypothetical protein
LEWHGWCEEISDAFKPYAPAMPSWETDERRAAVTSALYPARPIVRGAEEEVWAGEFIAAYIWCQNWCQAQNGKIKKKPATLYAMRVQVATLIGLEPTTSCVTGRRSNQLSYSATLFHAGLRVPISPRAPRVSHRLLK